MARQCTQPKRPRNAAWFKDKAMLAEAQESGQILDEEQLAFLADPGIPDDAYDSDCDDVSNAKAVLMANLSNYGSDVISEVPHSESYHNDVDNQSMHAMQDFEQTLVVDFPDNEITNSMILSVIEQMSEQMTYHVYNWERGNQEKNNESLTAETTDVLLTVMNSTTVYSDYVNLEMQSSESCDKFFDLDAKLFKKQNAYNELLRKFFENNDLKAQLQAKDTTIRKLKEHIKSIRENDKEDKVKQDFDEIKTINIELEHTM
ncbi:hypothetical protein Tco_0092622 [Tanacetum coccineum]